MTRHLGLVLIISLFLLTAVYAESPTESFLSFTRAAMAQDGEATWNMLSGDSQKAFDDMYSLVTSFVQNDPQGMAEMAKSGICDGKSLWVIAMKESGGDGELTAAFKNVEVMKEEVNGNKAKLTVKGEFGTDKIDMIKENGKWFVDLSTMMQQATEGTDKKDTSASKGS